MSLAWCSYKPEKAPRLAANLLKAFPGVFPTHTDQSVFQTCKQRKMNLWQTLKAFLEALFLQHSGLHTLDEVTQLALAALLVNGLPPEISGLIKGQRAG